MSRRRSLARRRGVVRRRAGRSPAFQAHPWARESKSRKRRTGFRPVVFPTGAGVRLLFLLVVMAFAAFNTRNNLLYLMFSVGLAGVSVSILAGWLSLKWLELEAQAPGELHAGTAAKEHFTLRNRSRFFASYGTELEELDFPGPSPRASAAYLGAGETAKISLEKVYSRRGVFQSARMRLRTRFPFGLFQATREVHQARRFTVFPRVTTVDISFAFQGRSGSVPERHRRGESEELLRLREYVSGDNLHHIHWKSTAKLGRLMTREFSARQQRRFSIVFDNTSVDEGQTDGNSFEKMVSAAASLASHLAAHRLSFSFASADDTFPPEASGEHLRGVLTYLAGVQVRPRSSPNVDLAGWVAHALRRGETIFLLRVREDGWLPDLSSPQLHAIDPATVLVQEETLGV